MTETGKRAKNATITDLGIKNAKAFWNLSSKELSKIAVEKGQAKITSQGAIAINTGEFTGRSPLDRFIVKDNLTKEQISMGLNFTRNILINKLKSQIYELNKFWFNVFKTSSISSSLSIFFLEKPPYE